MIEITATISLEDSELVERSARASGPGGQHVNKTSNAIELRFDVRNSPSLNDQVRARLEALCGSRLTKDGVLVLFSDGSRSQEMNRQEVRARLVDLIKQAAIIPKRRRPTRPTLSSKIKRLDTKKLRGSTKSLRSRPQADT